jgi:hypothetical protein
MGDSKPSRYVLTPLGRRLLAVELPRDNAEALCPEDEQVHEDEHYLEDEQYQVLVLLVDWVRDAPPMPQDVAAIAGYRGKPLAEVKRIVDELVKSRVIAVVPADR